MPDMSGFENADLSLDAADDMTVDLNAGLGAKEKAVSTDTHAKVEEVTKTDKKVD